MAGWLVMMMKTVGLFWGRLHLCWSGSSSGELGAGMALSGPWRQLVNPLKTPWPFDTAQWGSSFSRMSALFTIGITTVEPYAACFRRKNQNVSFSTFSLSFIMSLPNNPPPHHQYLLLYVLDTLISGFSLWNKSGMWFSLLNSDVSPPLPSPLIIRSQTLTISFSLSCLSLSFFPHVCLILSLKK